MEPTSKYIASSQDIRSFLSIPPSLSDHPFPNYYTMKVFIILYSTFCFALAGKDNAIIHISQAITQEGKPTVGFAMVLMSLSFFLSVTNFSPISNTLVSLEQDHWTNTSGKVET